VYYNKNALAFGSVVVLSVAALVVIALSLWAWPKYNLYRMEMQGRAALKEC
jgi:cytochrome c-type biogenesis protein CcmH/NrfG